MHAYLTFNGNCRQAMQFYQKCLGGELLLQTVGDSPTAAPIPAKMKKCILHATLSCKDFVLMGSDMVAEQGLVKGNAVSIVLDCSNEKEIKATYKKLSEAGEQTHPLEDTHWGALFGGLTDKYGNNWLLHYYRKQKK